MANLDIKQRIGIYYNHLTWGNRVFDKIINEIPEDQIVYCKRRNTGNSYCQLINGDIIQTIPANGKSRGYKVTKVFMEPGIDQETYQTVIKPAVLYTIQTVWDEDLEYDGSM